eukprot:s721_g7.t1
MEWGCYDKLHFEAISNIARPFPFFGPEGLAAFDCASAMDAAELAQDARDAGQRFLRVQARPIVQWADRDVQTVNQEDIWANYELLRDYLLLVGGTSPVPDLIHHQACMILISVTYNLHSHDWASQEGTRLKCMGAYLMHLTQKSTSSRDKQIQCLKTIIIRMHGKNGLPLKKRSKSSQSLSSQSQASDSQSQIEPAEEVQDAYSGDAQPEAMLVTPMMKHDLEKVRATEVRATEVKLLESPEEELWLSVKKVLDFRDELDSIVEVAQSSKKARLESNGTPRNDPSHQLVEDALAKLKRSPLVKKPLELPDFMKEPQDKKTEEIQKDERKRKRQEEKERKALEPKRPRGRPRKDQSKKDESKKVESKKDDQTGENSSGPKANGKRGQAKPSEQKVKKARVPEPVPAKSSSTPPRRSKRSTSCPAKAWKASPMAVKTRSKSSPKKECDHDYQSSDARTQRAVDALKELHGVMKKVSGFSMPDLKSFSKKSYTIDSGAGDGYPTIGHRGSLFLGVKTQKKRLVWPKLLQGGNDHEDCYGYMAMPMLVVLTMDFSGDVKTLAQCAGQPQDVRKVHPKAQALSGFAATMPLQPRGVGLSLLQVTALLALGLPPVVIHAIDLIHATGKGSLDQDLVMVELFSGVQTLVGEFRRRGCTASLSCLVGWEGNVMAYRAAICIAVAVIRGAVWGLENPQGSKYKVLPIYQRLLHHPHLGTMLCHWWMGTYGAWSCKPEGGMGCAPWLPFLKQKLTQPIREGIRSRADILGKTMVKKTVSKSGHQQVTGHTNMSESSAYPRFFGSRVADLHLEWMDPWIESGE